MQALEYCQHKAAGESDFLARSRLLPRAKRDAIAVLYAYCHELDDVVSHCTDTKVAMTTLHWWQQQLTAVFTADTASAHPVMQALQPVTETYRLPENELAAILQGMIIHLTQVRYPMFADLQRHIEPVTGMMERLTARILGFSQAQTLSFASQLGLAVRMTRIIRDVGEDARRGRIYLPMDDLQRFDVSAAAILDLDGGEAFQALMAFEIERTEQLYRDALMLLPAADAKAQKSALMMAAVNHSLLQEIKADGAANVLRYKLNIPRPRQTRIALKTWLWGFKP